MYTTKLKHAEGPQLSLDGLETADRSRKPCPRHYWDEIGSPDWTCRTTCIRDQELDVVAVKWKTPCHAGAQNYSHAPRNCAFLTLCEYGLPANALCVDRCALLLNLGAAYCTSAIWLQACKSHVSSNPLVDSPSTMRSNPVIPHTLSIHEKS